MMNDPNAAPMGGEAPMAAPGEQPQQMGAVDAAVLDMHLTEDVKKALSAKGIDVSAVADRGPKEPVVVIPVSIIMNKYRGASTEESMKQFVQDMTANAQPPATEPMPQPAMAEAPPSPEGLGAPTMDRPPMTA